jgi:hypothetical protein
MKCSHDIPFLSCLSCALASAKQSIANHCGWCHICRGGRWCDDRRYLEDVVKRAAKTLKDSQNPVN